MEVKVPVLDCAGGDIGTSSRGPRVAPCVVHAPRVAAARRRPPPPPVCRRRRCGCYPVLHCKNARIGNRTSHGSSSPAALVTKGASGPAGG